MLLSALFHPLQVVKIGEGSYGEAFKLQGVVVKLVPIEGTIPYNDGVQKTAPELEAEALIALTLNQLREQQPLSRAAAAEEVTSNGECDAACAIIRVQSRQGQVQNVWFGQPTQATQGSATLLFYTTCTTRSDC
jgi:hypothetical protein